MSDQEQSTPDPSPMIDHPPPAADPGDSTHVSGPGTNSTPASGGKADIGKRVVALLIDLLLVFVIGFVPAIGGLVGAAYMLLRDGLEFDFMNHRSIGKNVMKLHVETVDGAPLEVMTSVKRNWLFAFGPLAQAAAFIPIVGWLFAIFIAIPAAFIAFVVETVLVLTDPDGRRIGDKIAATVVRED